MSKKLSQSSGSRPLLTQERLKHLLAYEPDTGRFVRLRSVGGAKKPVGSVVGTRHVDGRVLIRIDGVLHQAHRLAVLHQTGNFPPGVVDHINGDRSDNRWENLRCVDQSTNNENKYAAQSNNRSTGVQGVHFERWSGKFLAHITVRGRHINLGRFDSFEAAAGARARAKAELHRGTVPDRLAAMVAAGTANFNKSQTLKAQVATATTAAEVEAIAWD